MLTQLGQRHLFERSVVSALPDKSHSGLPSSLAFWPLKMVMDSFRIGGYGAASSGVAEMAGGWS